MDYTKYNFGSAAPRRVAVRSSELVHIANIDGATLCGAFSHRDEGIVDMSAQLARQPRVAEGWPWCANCTAIHDLHVNIGIIAQTHRRGSIVYNDDVGNSSGYGVKVLIDTDGRGKLEQIGTIDADDFGSYCPRISTLYRPLHEPWFNDGCFDTLDDAQDEIERQAEAGIIHPTNHQPKEQSQ